MIDLEQVTNQIYSCKTDISGHFVLLFNLSRTTIVNKFNDANQKNILQTKEYITLPYPRSFVQVIMTEGTALGSLMFYYLRQLSNTIGKYRPKH